MNIITRLSEKRHNKDMRIVIFAIIAYGAYLLIRYILSSLAGGKPKNTVPPQEKPRRNIDPNNIEDAEFEEIKKDK